MAKYKMEDKGFLRGVIYSAALIYELNNDSVAVEELIGTLGGDLDFACQISNECDVIKLREITPSLPIGEGADYCTFDLKHVDFDGEETEEIEDVYYFIIYATNKVGETVNLSKFQSQNEAEEFYDRCVAWKKKQGR